MFFLRSVNSRPEFREGMRAMTGVVPGIAAWGLMTGVAMVKSGMSVTESVAMTVLVYAGSSQLAAIPLIIAGAPAWVIWATAFCVNLRFVVFSLHLRDYLMYMPRWRRSSRSRWRSSCRRGRTPPRRGLRGPAPARESDA